MASSWSWRAGTADQETDAARAVGLGQAFPTQGEAESWLGEVYPELRATGVEAVSLYEEQRLVYGPMSLDP